MAGTSTIKRIDKIQPNTSGNVELEATGDVIINTPNAAQDELLSIDASNRLRSTGLSVTSITLNNVGVVDPDSSNSGNEGYSVGSRWFNSVNNNFFVCTDASFTPAVIADYDDQVAGMTTDVQIDADVAGIAGNSIVLSFDGIDDINTVLTAWNLANPGNTASLVGGDGAQIPDNLESITLTGGVDIINAAVWGRARDVIIDTDANINLLPRVAGNIYYATDTELYYGDDGTDLVSLGGGGGGVVQDTLANIIGFTRSAGSLYLATDTGDFLGDDGTILTSLNTLQDTLANLTALSRFEGRIVYATDTSLAYIDDGTSLNSLVPAAIKVAYFKEVLAPATSNGTFTSGSYITRVLNTHEGDMTFASLAANQVTLDPGLYRITAHSPGYSVNEHKAAIYNVTDATYPAELVGLAARCQSGNNENSTVSGVFNIVASKIIELRHRCASTNVNGLGITSGAFTTNNSVYAQLIIEKLS